MAADSPRPRRRDVAAVDRAVRHGRDELTISVDCGSLPIVLAFIEKLNAIERDYEAGRIDSAGEYHRRIVEARTWWEMHG